MADKGKAMNIDVLSKTIASTARHFGATEVVAQVGSESYRITGVRFSATEDRVTLICEEIPSF